MLIIIAEFSTSQLEMECVVDVFDRNGDGYIDSKEYIETLRPEREVNLFNKIFFTLIIVYV